LASQALQRGGYANACLETVTGMSKSRFNRAQCSQDIAQSHSAHMADTEILSLDLRM